MSKNMLQIQAMTIRFY